MKLQKTPAVSARVAKIAAALLPGAKVTKAAKTPATPKNAAKTPPSAKAAPAKTAPAKALPKVKPFTMPKGAQWFAVIGTKGVALIPAMRTRAGAIVSFHDGQDWPEVALDTSNKVVAPWDATGAHLAVKAYVSNRKSAVEILPLAEAIKAGKVKTVKLAAPTRAGETELVVLKGWNPAIQTPNYCGEKSSRGHVEPRAIIDNRKGKEGEPRNASHLENRLTFVK